MKNYNGIYFIDIETIPVVPEIASLGERARGMFTKRFKKQIEESAPENAEQNTWLAQAAFHAEFNRIICCSVGTFTKDGELKIGSLKGAESHILENLRKMIERDKPWRIVAHNGKNFDFPILARKYVNTGSVPDILNIMFKKPWESAWVDTQELFGFGEWNYRISLDRLAWFLGLPSPKESMDGSMVFKAFMDGRIEEIAKYCDMDVRVLAASYCRMMGDSLDEVKKLFNQ